MDQAPAAGAAAARCPRPLAPGGYRHAHGANRPFRMLQGYSSFLAPQSLTIKGGGGTDPPAPRPHATATPTRPHKTHPTSHPRRLRAPLTSISRPWRTAWRKYRRAHRTQARSPSRHARPTPPPHPRSSLACCLPHATFALAAWAGATTWVWKKRATRRRAQP